jgi:hypothetical protein
MPRHLQSVLTLQQGVGHVRHRAAIRDQHKFAAAQRMGARGDDRSLRTNAEAIRQDQSRPFALLDALSLSSACKPRLTPLPSSARLRHFLQTRTRLARRTLRSWARRNFSSVACGAKVSRFHRRGAVAQHASTAKKPFHAGNGIDRCHVVRAPLEEETVMGFGRGALLWLLGVPLPIVILLALFWHH